MAKVWFEDWFDSEYYHMLYQNHDGAEAAAFLNKLLTFLDPSKDARCLDLACGKGRHAIHLAEHGFDVVGMDLSKQSIAAARAFEHDRLHFYSHDMRQPFHMSYFDYVFNLFTSFGYFKTNREHISALRNMKNSLKSDGKLVIDFFNAAHVIQHLVPKSKIVRGDITFSITKKVAAGVVTKKIKFIDKLGKPQTHQEQVRLFTLADFTSMLTPLGLKIEHTFGDYQLNPFDESVSPRLIFIISRM